MKEFKKIFLLFLLFIMTGCDNSNYEKNTINYNLNIDKSYQEKIFFALPKDSYNIVEEDKKSDHSNLTLEYGLLELDNNPLYRNNDVFYNKKIGKTNDQINVLLDYEYTDDEFIYSNYIMSCFEYYDVKSTSDYFTINLSGKFYCMYDMDTVNINVTTNHEVDISNGLKKDNSYNWTITENNFQNVNIYFKLKRNYDDMFNVISKNDISLFGIIKNIFLLLIVIVVIFLIINFYKKNKNGQEV